MYVCAPCVCSALGSQKRMSDPRGLELEVVLGHRIGAETQTEVFRKSSQRS